MPTMETGIYGLWGGAQTAKGSPVAAPGHRFKMVAGGWQLNRADGSEAFSDLSKHGDESDWVDTLAGAGTPGIEATPSELAWLLWAFTGGETATAVTGPPAKTKHSTVPLPGLGKYLTFFGRKGQTLLMRQQHYDSLISQLVIEGSTGNKAVRITPSWLSLNPAIWKTADPTQAMPAGKPMLYTDGTGTFTIDGVVFKGHSQFTLTLNEDLSVEYGDDNKPYDFSIGNPQIALGVTAKFDSDGLAQYNKLAYGSATPAADTAPLTRLPALGSYSFYLKARDSAGALTGDEFKLTMAGVKWTLPDAPDPAPAGGSTELALGGAARKVGTNPLWAIDVNNDDTAYTVGT
jgi:hypothetical protein